MSLFRGMLFLCVVRMTSSRHRHHFVPFRSKARVQPKCGGYGAENAYHRLDDYLPCFFVFHNSKKTPSAPLGHLTSVAATQIDI